jgi:hypothetical protein
MPLPNNLTRTFNLTVHGKFTGIAAAPKKQVSDLMEFSGLDNFIVVRDSPPNELTAIKLRAIIPADHELATITPGTLAKIANFLRKWQDGTYARFEVDHDLGDDSQVEVLVEGSDDHDYLSEWTEPVIEEAIIIKLVIVDATTFRALIAYVKCQYGSIAYLMEEGVVDNYSKTGKKKDVYFKLFLTRVLTISHLSHTFLLGTNVKETGLALFRKAKAYFLNAQDIQAEIQELQLSLATLNFDDYSSFQSFAEAAQLTVTSLKELGKTVENVELYTLLRGALSKSSSPHIQQLCVAFKVINAIPTNETLSLFLNSLTTDPEVMSFRNNLKEVNQLEGKEASKKGGALTEKQKAERRAKRDV